MLGDRISIDKKYVHKFKDENVFLCNLRRALPLTIARDVFERDVRSALSNEEFALLNKFYQPDLPDAKPARWPEPDEDYVLAYLPALRLLTGPVFQTLLHERKLSWERELLQSLYEPDPETMGAFFRLRDDLCEPYDGFLLSIFNAWNSYINSEERAILAAALEKVPAVPRRDIFLANMFVNTGHPFFFEHPNDHVPAIMLVETVRQFLLACSHRFGNVPFKDTQIIVNSMNARFLSYININYPILFRGTTLKVKKNRNGMWKYQEVKAEVFQGSKLMAEFSFNGNCISSELFQEIREEQLDELRQSRFVPLFSEKYRLEVRQEGSGKTAEAVLFNVSLEGMSIGLGAGDFSPAGEVMDIVLTRGNGAVIKGSYRRVWHNVREGQVVMGLKSLSMSAADLRNLHDLICRGCEVEEKREFM